MGGNFCYTKNIVVDLDGQEYIKTFNIIREGEPIDAWYLYQADGFYNSYEEIANSVTVGSGVKPGYIRSKNLHNDDKIDDHDRAVKMCIRDSGTCDRFGSGSVDDHRYSRMGDGGSDRGGRLARNHDRLFGESGRPA